MPDEPDPPSRAQRRAELLRALDYRRRQVCIMRHRLLKARRQRRDS